MRVGFDLDGVIAEAPIPVWLLTGLVENKAKRDIIYNFLHCQDLKRHPNEFLNEDDEFVIITSRSEQYRSLTERWLKVNGINCPLKICDVGLSSDYLSLEEYFEVVAREKAKYINSECLDVYFEDSPDAVIRLRKLCPQCKIIQVGGRLL